MYRLSFEVIIHTFKTKVIHSHYATWAINTYFPWCTNILMPFLMASTHIEMYMFNFSLCVNAKQE